MRGEGNEAMKVPTVDHLLGDHGRGINNTQTVNLLWADRRTAGRAAPEFLPITGGELIDAIMGGSGIDDAVFHHRRDVTGTQPVGAMDMDLLTIPERHPLDIF